MQFSIDPLHGRLPQMAGESGALERVARLPFWLRAEYVEEVYRRVQNTPAPSLMKTNWAISAPARINKVTAGWSGLGPPGFCQDRSACPCLPQRSAGIDRHHH